MSEETFKIYRSMENDYLRNKYNPDSSALRKAQLRMLDMLRWVDDFWGSVMNGIMKLIDWIVMLFTMVLPRDKRMILFGAWWGNKYDDNSRALFEYTIKNRKDIKAYWMTPNKSIINKVKELGYPVVYSKSLRGIYLASRANYVCYCTSCGDIGKNLRKYLGGCVIVNLWHGVVTKKIMYDDQITRKKKGIVGRINVQSERYVNKKWFVVCTSDIYYPIFRSAFRTTIDKILNLGQARNDYFFMDTPNKYKEAFAGKKIIVYMPTHRQEGKKSMNMYHILDLPLINEMLDKHNAVLVIKKHYYHRAEPSVGKEYNNIIEMTNENPDTFALLKAADVLVTDYSSCYNDYLLLNRPQIFFCYDMDDYLLNDREMYFDYYSNVPGPICKNNSELIKELDKVLSGVDNYKEKRQQRLDFFYSKENQGIVAPRQLETILSL